MHVGDSTAAGRTQEVRRLPMAARMRMDMDMNVHYTPNPLEPPRNRQEAWLQL